jgi:hypothetical protein
MHVRRLEETGIHEKNARFVLQDFEGDGRLVWFAMENAEGLFLEAEEGMAEVGGFDSTGQGEADLA